MYIPATERGRSLKTLHIDEPESNGISRLFTTRPIPTSTTNAFCMAERPIFSLPCRTGGSSRSRPKIPVQRLTASSASLTTRPQKPDTSTKREAKTSSPSPCSPASLILKTFGQHRTPAFISSGPMTSTALWSGSNHRRNSAASSVSGLEES